MEAIELTPLINRYMQIEDVTTGGEKQDFLFRYRGTLRSDSQAAYDELADSLRLYNLTPLFRLQNDQHVILVLSGVLNPKPSNPRLNVILFILTMFSMVFAGALFSYAGPDTGSPLGTLWNVMLNLGSGVPFAASLLAILTAHEFGHYFAGRFHKTNVTLPYFIPLPLSPFGTMGAFIQLKEPPKNRRILLDIGIAGPLAGMVVAIPVLLLGLSLSHVGPIDMPLQGGVQLEGNSLLYLFSKFLVFGQFLPAPASYGSLPPFLYWIRYFFTGQPIPLGGYDVMLHPVAWAGWAGLLVTALNLIPAGTLDGGHVVYVLLGAKVRYLLPVILVALVLLGFIWNGWWLWALLLLVLGRIYAEPLDQITPLDTPRKVLAVLGLVLFALVFTPVPLIQVMAGG